MTNSFYKVFLTGGAGYIGSHTCVKFLSAILDMTVFVSFCISHSLVLARSAPITCKKPALVQGDIIQERVAFKTTLLPSGTPEVMHFVVLKSVGESVQKPLADYENKVAGCLNLLQVF